MAGGGQRPGRLNQRDVYARRRPPTRITKALWPILGSHSHAHHQGHSHCAWPLPHARLVSRLCRPRAPCVAPDTSFFRPSDALDRGCPSVRGHPRPWLERDVRSRELTRAHTSSGARAVRPGARAPPHALPHILTSLVEADLHSAVGIPVRAAALVLARLILALVNVAADIPVRSAQPP